MHIQLTGLGKVYAAPYDVEFAPNVVVQPDIIVVLNANSGVRTPSKIVGTPDLIVEVASPGTASYDRRGKQDIYARYGVPEYWIADPHARTVELLVLENGAYRTVGVYQGQATLPSQVMPNLPVRVEQFFA
jgi:Uma2 family endonuclease